MLGQIIGTFRIEQKLGEGGMGAVWRGRDQMLERDVAIKVLRPELARQPELVARFRSEAVTLARLNHSSIATLYNFLRHGDDYLMVMEFVRGLTLEEFLRRHGALDIGQAVRIFCQALEGIAHAHALGVIHRDLKPANLMLTASGEVKVMDFGIARVLGTARQTKTGRLIGTLEYMSPEQMRGEETDARADIYSLGMLLYEMLTGRVPFESMSDYELMRAQVEDDPPPPRDFNAALPLAVELAVLRALAKDPAARFQSAAEFRAALINAVPEAALKAEPSAAIIEPVLKATRQAFVDEAANNSAAEVRFDAPSSGQRNSGFEASTGTFTLRLPSFLTNAHERFAARVRQLTWKQYGSAATAMLTLVIGLYAFSGKTSPPEIVKPVEPAPTPAPVASEAAPIIKPLSDRSSAEAPAIEPREPEPVSPKSAHAEQTAGEAPAKRQATPGSKPARQQTANNNQPAPANSASANSATVNSARARATASPSPSPSPSPKPGKFDRSMETAGKVADAVGKFGGLFRRKKQ